MKKLLLSLVVLIAALSLTACSESTAIDDGVLTDYHCIRGIVYKIEGGSFLPFNSVEVSLLKSGIPGTYKLTLSYDAGGTWGDGFYNFDMVGESAGFYKLTAEKGGYSGETSWFYWSGGSHEINVVMTQD